MLWKRQIPQLSATKWPEWEPLEAALTECSELIESGKTADALLPRRQLPEVGWAVNLKTLPSGSGNVEMLRQLLGGLSSKVNRLASPEVNTTMMREAITGVKPIVAVINRVSGAGGN